MKFDTKLDRLREVSGKFAFLLSVWVVSKVEPSDVTVWSQNSSTKKYITFNPISFSFSLRAFGEALNVNDVILGVQEIDFSYINTLSDSLFDSKDPSFKGMTKKEIFHTTYASEVIRYWSYYSEIRYLLEKSIESLSLKEVDEFFDNIDISYRYFKKTQTEGSISKVMFSLSSNAKSEFQLDYGIVTLN
jgi:hypothetical protein